MTHRHVIRNPAREQITAAIKAAIDGYPGARTDLARRIGVSRKQTYEWEAGNNTPSLETLAALAEVTGVPIVLAFGPESKPHEEAAPPEWAERLSNQIVAEVRVNRQTIREAIVGPDEDQDAALVELVKDDLRPLFQELASQFRAEVRQLLDARFGGTDPD